MFVFLMLSSPGDINVKKSGLYPVLLGWALFGVSVGGSRRYNHPNITMDPLLATLSRKCVGIGNKTIL